MAPTVCNITTNPRSFRALGGWSIYTFSTYLEYLHTCTLLKAFSKRVYVYFILFCRCLIGVWVSSVSKIYIYSPTFRIRTEQKIRKLSDSYSNISNRFPGNHHLSCYPGNEELIRQHATLLLQHSLRLHLLHRHSTRVIDNPKHPINH